MGITKEQLNKYYSEHLDELVEWADDIDKYACSPT